MCLKKNTVETILLLQEVFQNEVLGVSTVKRWHKMFLDDTVCGVRTMWWEAENRMHDDEYQYCRDRHQIQLSSVSTSP